MLNAARTIGSLILVATLAQAVLAAGDAGPDQPLRAVLEESKEKGRGVTLYVNGATISVVVVAIEDGYVIARNRESGRIVVRLERIDAAAGAF